MLSGARGRFPAGSIDRTEARIALADLDQPFQRQVAERLRRPSREGPADLSS
jgi:hypothetical protein